MLGMDLRSENWAHRALAWEKGAARRGACYAGGYSPYCYDAQFIVGGTIERQVHFV